MYILFICKSNQFRSQMAEALYNKMTGTTDARSAGTYVGSSDEPEGTIISTRFQSPDFFELMEEHGMHIRDNRTIRLTPQMVEDADIVVSMAEDPFVPEYLRASTAVRYWNIDNPKVATREVSERTLQQVRRLVEDLIAAERGN